MMILKRLILTLSFAVLVAAPVLTLVAPQTSYAVKDVAECSKPILNIQPWFRGLVNVVNEKCEIIGPGQEVNGKTIDPSGFIWRIVLNVIDIGLAIVQYIAFFFILYGGFQFLTGGSNPGQIEKAKKTILNAVIGLVISLAATAIINLVFGIIG